MGQVPVQGLNQGMHPAFLQFKRAAKKTRANSIRIALNEAGGHPVLQAGHAPHAPARAQSSRGIF
eukprot:1161504-Pelagomonas_calceolata.AAC.4